MNLLSVCECNELQMAVDIKKNIEAVRRTLPHGVTLVAVSKYHPVEAVQAAYSAGHRDFGESRAQDLRIKQQQLPDDIRWHFIGHLQTNKIKYIASYVHLVHSVDSMRLLREIDYHGRKAGRVIPCLLQIHIADEESKFGFTPEECRAMAASGEWRELVNVQIRGLMCMATNTDDYHKIKEEFEVAKRLFDELRDGSFAECNFNILSAGMSDDYMIAVATGSTHVRIGSDIFGPPSHQ